MAHLDHVIVLVPYASLANPPAWISENFTITPGGQHADGRTENRLICFRDGSYVELIAFVNDDAKNRQGHVWGDRQFGIIDFALTHSTGDASALFSELEKRLEAVKWKDGEVKVAYEPPKAGGRTRPDGIDVRWTVTQPKVDTGYQRGELPFFCHDITPRSVRVPNCERALTHPSGAYGIKQLTIYVPESRTETLPRAYAAIAGASDSMNKDFHGILLERQVKITGTQDVRLVSQTPGEEWQLDAMRERGGVFLGVLTFGAMVGPDGLESSRRMADRQGSFGEIYLDQDR
ncbi:uncharacterized protein RSE6_06563 [Rhynchosporium secalis]|uniref:Glyoxalase-like domain-containing protein n=1 Tax=Rhynchosporium secalis TaxID=38038 RepID=A0A1E1MAQ6_RHYSE|nr:uncharacterized protein RSE6_06563 [Rhynchosporium secalis]